MNKILSVVVLLAFPVAGVFAQASKYGGVKKAATPVNKKTTNTKNTIDTLHNTNIICKCQNQYYVTESRIIAELMVCLSRHSIIT